MSHTQPASVASDQVRIYSFNGEVFAQIIDAMAERSGLTVMASVSTLILLLAVIGYHFWTVAALRAQLSRFQYATFSASLSSPPQWPRVVAQVSAMAIAIIQALVLKGSLRPSIGYTVIILLASLGCAALVTQPVLAHWFPDYQSVETIYASLVGYRVPSAVLDVDFADHYLCIGREYALIIGVISIIFFSVNPPFITFLGRGARYICFVLAIASLCVAALGYDADCTSVTPPS